MLVYLYILKCINIFNFNVICFIYCVLVFLFCYFYLIFLFLFIYIFFDLIFFLSLYLLDTLVTTWNEKISNFLRTTSGKFFDQPRRPSGILFEFPFPGLSECHSLVNFKRSCRSICRLHDSLFQGGFSVVPPDSRIH